MSVKLSRVCKLSRILSVSDRWLLRSQYHSLSHISFWCSLTESRDAAKRMTHTQNYTKCDSFTNIWQNVSRLLKKNSSTENIDAKKVRISKRKNCVECSLNDAERSLSEMICDWRLDKNVGYTQHNLKDVFVTKIAFENVVVVVWNAKTINWWTEEEADEFGSCDVFHSHCEVEERCNGNNISENIHPLEDSIDPNVICDETVRTVEYVVYKFAVCDVRFVSETLKTITLLNVMCCQTRKIYLKVICDIVEEKM